MHLYASDAVWVAIRGIEIFLESHIVAPYNNPLSHPYLVSFFVLYHPCIPFLIRTVCVPGVFTIPEIHYER